MEKAQQLNSLVEEVPAGVFEALGKYADRKMEGRIEKATSGDRLLTFNNSAQYKVIAYATTLMQRSATELRPSLVMQHLGDALCREIYAFAELRQRFDQTILTRCEAIHQAMNPSVGGEPNVFYGELAIRDAANAVVAVLRADVVNQRSGPAVAGQWLEHVPEHISGAEFCLSTVGA
jgi:hypothetical protein